MLTTREEPSLESRRVNLLYRVMQNAVIKGSMLGTGTIIVMIRLLLMPCTNVVL
ncbi:uncharacterized protein BDW43DRAFT_268797 [Aspergillus alliaceus]|uniref:uncharacterized protein n=1 Tax=Petromyces alliaceus TaxID=209559 RepID=UPI0012A59F00|nr:uncharacterized protein BDW43DRAFT_268797 [Aspergillus alliaceus]KAB8235997.1 hypothetical protein BDW43DRAFT_268797 [Aspergillus alliaceus]